MQKNNMSIEKASIDSLLVLKDFNEEVRQVSAEAARQCQDL
mgnify:CR=1 FL=1